MAKKNLSTFRSMRIFVGIVNLLQALFPSWTQATGDVSFLMIGNSFTNANHLQEMIQGMLEQDLAISHHQPVYALRFRKPASRLSEDVQDPALHTTIAERPWTWVMLQEQSQIPAFWGTRFQHDFDLSVEAVQQMDTWIAAGNVSETVLLMTWGRRTADWAWYPDMFPNFLAMQTKVSAGYVKLQDAISTPQRPVRIAPAGLAFEHVYNGIPGNASADGTDFSRLYDVDGTHPSLEGSYLVACVVYATMTGHDPRLLSTSGAAGSAAIPASHRERLQQVAYDTVQQYNQENHWNREYWRLHPDTHDHGNNDNNNNNNNPVPSPPNAPSKPYVPKDAGKDDTTSSSSSSSKKGYWLFVTASGIAVGVWYNQRRQRQRRRLIAKHSQPIVSGGGYADTSPHDLELTDLPSSTELA